MNSKAARITGWVLSVLLGAFLLFSASGKFMDFEGKAEMLAHLGYSESLLPKIGVLEIALTILFLIPRTAFLGAILLTGYLGGATATHVRIGDDFYFPIVMGVVMWVALGLRTPDVFRLAFGPGPGPATPPVDDRR
jgi:hypothetical protein